MRAKPRKRDILIELVRRKRQRKAIRKELHERQRRVVRSTARYIALLCGRRSGKTELCARLIALELIDAGRNEWVIFGARTQSIAKDLIWSHLERLNEDYGLQWSMQKHLGTIETPAGAHFRVIGIDDKVAIQKVRGYKLRLAIFDEASTYETHLEELIRDCLSPALSDLRGRLVLSGTPGPTCTGYWFEASTDKESKYEKHSWTVRENPKYPRDVEEMLAEERALHRWTEEDTTYRREYFAEWVDDTNLLVYAFVRSRNTCTELPEPFDKATWLTTMGVDFGYTDEAAWVVLGSPKHSRDIYVLHAEKHSGLLPDEAAAITAQLYERFGPSRMVGDGGGLGKPYIEEFNRRWAREEGVSVTPADKSDKVGTISLLNGDLRTTDKHPQPVIRLYLPDAEDLAREIQLLPWLDKKKQKEHPAYGNHAADAFLYAWKVHTSYWHRPKKAEPTKAEREAAERRERARRAKQGNRDWFKRPHGEALPLAA